MAMRQYAQVYDGRPGQRDGQPVDRERADELLRAVYDKHGTLLLRMATSLLKGDYHQAQDLVQETALRAWRHADTLDPRAEGIRSWLVHVLRNLTIDAHRARTSRPPETTDAEIDELFGFEPTDDILTRKIVRAALANLSYQHREVLMYVHFLDRSVAQTSQALGVPSGTVKSRTHLALRALRATLIEHGYELRSSHSAERAPGEIHPLTE